MAASVHIYDRLVEFKNQNLVPAGYDDHVFLSEYSNRNIPVEVLRRLFRRTLKDSEIEKRTGINVSLYSLRHTSITMRLLIGRADLLARARSERTGYSRLRLGLDVGNFGYVSMRCRTNHWQHLRHAVSCFRILPLNSASGSNALTSGAQIKILRGNASPERNVSNNLMSEDESSQKTSAGQLS